MSTFWSLVTTSNVDFVDIVINGDNVDIVIIFDNIDIVLIVDNVKIDNNVCVLLLS